MVEVLDLDREFSVEMALAQLKLSDSGFNTISLAEIDLPNLDYTELPNGDTVGYRVYGDLSSKNIIFTGPPFGNSIDTPSKHIRFAAQQAAIGDHGCIVAVEAVDLSVLGKSKSDLKLVRNGDFKPFSERLLAVVDSVSPKEDQNVIFLGYSQHADVSIDATHLSSFSEAHGLQEVHALNAWDPARTKIRSLPKMAICFATSGDELYNNVINSDSPALLEAFGIDPKDKRAEIKFLISCAKELGAFVLRNPRAAFALTSGFGTDTSINQLVELQLADQMPRDTIVGSTGTDLFTADALGEIAEYPDIRGIILRGEGVDHSAADKLITSARFALMALQKKE